MAANNAERERLAFSARLQQALKNENYAPDSPTQLAREFNIRYNARPVTVHAARKWLIGEAIPAQAKLRLLAQWLGVSAEWLRFGEGAANSSGASNSPQLAAFTRKEFAIIENLRRLDSEQQQLILKLVMNLAKVNDANSEEESAPAEPVKRKRA